MPLKLSLFDKVWKNLRAEDISDPWRKHEILRDFAPTIVLELHWFSQRRFCEADLRLTRGSLISKVL